MKWNQLKKRLESLLADSVKQRIEFKMTGYHRGHDYHQRASILFDQSQIFTTTKHYLNWMNDDIIEQYQDSNIFGSDYFIHSLYSYVDLPFTEILTSTNLIVHAIRMLDKRLGKSRLKKMDISNEHDLVKRLFYIRCKAEGIDQDDTIDIEELRTPIPEKEIAELIADKERWKRIYAEADHKLRETGKGKNIRQTIDDIYHNRFSSEAIKNEIQKEIYQAFECTQHRNILYESLRYLERKTKLLQELKFTRAVIGLIEHFHHWVKPLEDWKIKTHNIERQFSSVARHLLTEFNVPIFMDKAWFNGNKDHQEWFIHIGTGKNICTIPSLPVRLTRKMAHYFLLAPDNYTIDAAIRWGQIHALGGDKFLADAVIKTRLGNDFHDNSFVETVIRFFIRHPMLDRAHVNPIVDYIWNQKYEDRIIFIDRGVPQGIGPERPNFSMRGRTPDSLLREVEEWHIRLGRESSGENLQWAKTGINEFHFSEGDKNSPNFKMWRIRELLNGQELIQEGRELKHCVSSYAKSCYQGEASIWTMEVETQIGIEKLLTIEVKNAMNEIRQIRGKRNRLPDKKEKSIIGRWAEKENLQLSAYAG